MRKLVFLSLGFGVGCLLGAYAPGGKLIWILSAFGVALAVPALAASRESKVSFAVGLLLLGFFLGCGRYGLFQGVYLDIPRALEGQEAEISVRTNDFSYETDYGRSVDGTVVLDGRSYGVRAYLEEGEQLEPGMCLSGRFRIKATVDAGENGSYHPGKGIFLLAYQRGDVTVFQDEGRWSDLPAKWRRDIQRILKECFPEDTLAFVQALLLGDTTGLDYETDTSLKVSGIRHVVAVSGLHVSILFALVSTITFWKRFLMALVGFPVLVLFAAVAGFTPSVVRACVMSGLMLLAMLVEKEYDGPAALSFSALVLLVWNPLVITSVSFQLSVASVTGIFLFSPGIKGWILAGLLEEWNHPVGEFFAKWIAVSVSYTLGAMVFTAPLCGLYFGTVSLIGTVTNLLTLWVISGIFYGAMGCCLLSLIAPGAAVWIAGGVSWLVRYVLMMAKVLADFPLAAVYTVSPYITAWLFFVYVLLVFFLLAKKRRALVLGCCAVLGLCVSLIAGWAEPLCSDVRFTVLDVGQGQCLLLQCGGRNYMIDCGGDGDEEAADIAAQTLLSQGIKKLDALIITHLDRDHAAGAELLLSRIKTELLVLPNAYSTLAAKTHGKVVYAAQDMVLSDESVKISVFTPNFEGNSNEMSLCLLLDTEKCDILITGDRNVQGERLLLHKLGSVDVDILMAGHHGSGNSTGTALLSAVQPEIVCISVGNDNTYGHPADKLLERLEEFGCAVYRTDRQGSIVFRR